jgi:hypothetical protein
MFTRVAVALILLVWALVTLYQFYRVSKREAARRAAEGETHYEDLSPCLYFPWLDPMGEKLKAVGWLSKDYPYTRGKVQKEFFRRLLLLLKQAWQPGAFAGCHTCGFCAPWRASDSLELYQMGVHMGVANLFVPGDGIVYVAPSMIAHYIRAHGYAPPMAFCAAVLNCPEMGSDEYRVALAANGPQSEEWARAI